MADGLNAYCEAEIADLNAKILFLLDFGNLWSEPEEDGRRYFCFPDGDIYWKEL